MGSDTINRDNKSISFSLNNFYMYKLVTKLLLEELFVVEILPDSITNDFKLRHAGSFKMYVFRM